MRAAHRSTSRATSLNVAKTIRSCVLLACLATFLHAGCQGAHAQQATEVDLSGPDSHEHSVLSRRHLFGNWDGERSRLLDRGVQFDLQYLSDSLWNARSDEKLRLASWNRVRGTVDLDFGKMLGAEGWTFHITALWQAGGNMGTYLGLVTGPSGMASANTFRLDSWWIEKRFLSERLTVRAGQFAGQDFYGAQHDAASFIFEPMGYALSNLSNTYEVFDPPSTPAFEVRTAPLEHVYLKSMVMTGDRVPYAHNPTGLVPQFRGAPVVASEVGFTPGKRAAGVRAFDNIEERKGYTGLYQVGATYNPGKFTLLNPSLHRSGNYLIYAMANQAIYRSAPEQGRGIDLTAAYDWSPSDANLHDRELTAGLRFNEPLPIRQHNTMSVGYVRTGFSSFYAGGTNVPLKQAEHGAEFNVLIDVAPMISFQPVVQYYSHAGGSDHSAVVAGFRTKVDF
jgi:porin